MIHATQLIRDKTVIKDRRTGKLWVFLYPVTLNNPDKIVYQFREYNGQDLLTLDTQEFSTLVSECEEVYNRYEIVENIHGS